MKYHSMKALGLLLGIFVFGAFNPINDNRDKESMILHAVLNYLDALHFQPKPIDDQFSLDVYKNYIDDLDPGKRFLTQTDLSQLEVYVSQIDDQIRMRTFEFFDQSVILIDDAYDRAEKNFKELIDYPFDFTIDEDIQLDYEKRLYASDDIELKELWRKYLKYEMLSKAYDKMKAQDKDESEDKVIKSFEEIIEESREEIRENYDGWFDRLSKLRRSDRFESYINAITHTFDPHTDYLNPKEKQDFDIRMGGKLEGIGARLSSDGEFTKVVSIVPGGPAWKGKDLQVDDIITMVTQENGDQTDIKGMRLDDVVQKIRGDKGTIVTLAVKKADGTLTDVVIERDEVILDEGFARSLILEQTTDQDKIGYIRLPRFYSSFEGKNGNSCAEDVKKELIKLKEENVDGIVLDLRNNGGGSLRDVITMSGLFIEKGPIVQVKPREHNAKIYKDTDADVVYDGPLVVMVNHYSASASEILAAALQDYGRAVIVGSTSTFGKGTVQRFFNLDEAFKKSQLPDKLGDIKVTMQKFYRINGGSTQLKGVTPDIILPDNYQFLELGERDYESAMDWSVIEPLVYEQDVYQVPQLDNLIARSNERTSTDETFSMILENAKRLKKNQDSSTYSLNYEAFDDYWKAREEENKKYKDIMDEELNSFAISNLSQDIAFINSDESRIARNDDWIDGIKKDIYVDEVLNIMDDLKDRNIREMKIKKVDKP